MDILKFNSVEDRIITLRNIPVILDSDVAELYDVETREVNQAIRNNPDKFPEGYIIDISEEEYKSLRSKSLILEKQGRGKHVKYLPNAFTEKGLYMLATILKSKKATQTTIAIVEAFAKLRELSRVVSQLSETREKSVQKSLMQRSGEIIGDILGDDLQVTDSETTLEINFALMKFRHTVRQKKK